IVAVSITDTRPSANSATNSCLPVGDSARPVGSEPTSTGAPTAGAEVSLVTLTTVPAARLATYAVSSSGAITIELGSLPVLTIAIRASVEVSNTEIESVSGLTIATNRSFPVIAMVLDFDGRASTGSPPPPSAGASSPPLLQPTSDAPAASMAI